MVGVLDLGLGMDTIPREVDEVDLAGLALVHCNLMHARSGRHLVADGDDSVVLVLTSHVEESSHLVGVEIVSPCRDLDEGCPDHSGLW